MGERERVNILLVVDDPAKLLSYEAILSELEENLIKATSGREALTHLLQKAALLRCRRIDFEIPKQFCGGDMG